MALAYVGIGSNLGDRFAHLEAALAGIAGIGTISGGSPMYETAPIGDIDQDAFLNAVVAFETDLAPLELLEALLGIEASRGRQREVRWGPRTLDLDLLLYDGITLEVSGLTIPHPEIRNRRFVLVPLVQVDPGLRDGSGFYADALTEVADQKIRRVTGPLHPNGERWLVGIKDAVSLRRSNDVWTFNAHPDWANASDDMFGAYLSGVSLFIVREVAPEMSPVSISHRFLSGVPVGVEPDATIDIDRRTDRSVDVAVTMSVDGLVVGRSTISAITTVPATSNEPTAPEVAGIETTVPFGELIRSAGATSGLSALNWGPLESWERPDLMHGLDQVLRLWSPNAAVGTNDPYLTAASMLMPIDATIWPVTMQSMGLLPSGPAISTPTIGFGATFARLDADDLFHLAEAVIEHRSQSTVSGIVRIWGDDGRYRATGHSYNLIRGR